MLTSCRPLVVYVALKHIDTLNRYSSPYTFVGLLEDMMLSLRRRKSTALWDNEFLIGQLALYNPSYTEGACSNSMESFREKSVKFTDVPGVTDAILYESRLVCRHFAMPMCLDPTAYRNELGLVTSVDKPWVVSSYFPVQESLLWLALCSTQAFRQLAIRRVFRDSTPRLRTSLEYKNPLAAKSSGELLEAIAFCAIIRASQASFTGESVCDFLSRLFVELEIPRVEFSSCDYDYFREVVIPFFLPPCAGAEFLCLPSGSKVGQFIRPRDVEGVDGLSESVLLEAKDWARPVYRNDVVEIVQKFSRHPGPSLCLIICQTANVTMPPKLPPPQPGKLVDANQQEKFQSSLVLGVSSQKRTLDGPKYTFSRLWEPAVKPTRLVLLLPVNQLSDRDAPQVDEALPSHV